MFKYENGYPFAEIPAMAKAVEQNYVIQSEDYLKLEVYTNDGERIIDPDLELSREMAGNQNNLTRPEHRYLVLPDSTVNLPMIGYMKLGGLRLEEARNLLKESYSEFYKDPYVIMEYTNKRVILLGATGGQVVPLQNEKMSIVEILALAGGIPKNTKVHNIRLIRGSQVFIVDLGTLDGYYKTNMLVESGDIIYTEPIPRILTQSAQEISLIVSTITAFTTLLLLILQL